MFKHDIKPIFCIDVTSDKKNEVLNGSEFITQTASKQKVEEFDSKQEELQETINKSKLPSWLRIVESLLFLYFVMVFAASARAGLETALKNAPALVISGAVCGVIGLLLFITAKIKEKKVLKEENVEETSQKINEEFISIHEELNVPNDASDIDILSFKYKIKKGEIKPCTTGIQTTPYVNVCVKIYTTEDEVHIADVENVYSFKKSAIKLITTVDKRISIPMWNKDEDPRKGIFKQYKMTLNNMGDIFFKPYHILEIDHENQIFGLYFPCYELETIEKLTGIKAK